MKILKLIMKIILGLIIIIVSFLTLMGISVYYSHKNAEKICSSFQKDTSKELVIAELKKQNLDFDDHKPNSIALHSVIGITTKYGITPFPSACILTFEEDKLIEIRVYDD